MRGILLFTAFSFLLLAGCATERIVQRGDTDQLKQFLEKRENHRKSVTFEDDRVTFTKEVVYEDSDRLKISGKSYPLNQVRQITSRRINPLSFLVTGMGFGAVLFTNLPESKCVIASCDATSVSYMSDNALYKLGIAAATVVSVIIIERKTPQEVFVIEADTTQKQPEYEFAAP